MKYLKTYEKIYSDGNTMGERITDISDMTEYSKGIYKKYKFKLHDYVKYLNGGLDKENIYQISHVDILSNWKEDEIYGLSNILDNGFVRWSKQDNLIKVEDYEIAALKYNI